MSSDQTESFAPAGSLDESGKVSFDHIYNETDPRAYYGTLRSVDYRIPQLAKPYFAKLIAEYRQVAGVAVPTVVDLGCSYGVNPALLKCDATMDELYEHYDAADVDRATLLDRDREFLRLRERPEPPRFVGLDSSGPALSYALAAGFVDATVRVDLERESLTEGQQALLSGADLVISTGCVGYVGERTITSLVRANQQRSPWMAHFVLRMFPFDPVAEALDRLGYDSVRVEGVFQQRRFASPAEQQRVLENLSAAGVDPSGLEADGWLYAELYVSRPRGCGT